LWFLEVTWQKLSQNPQAQLRECFDLVSGTSAGGINALAVAMGIPMKRVLQMWQEEARYKIFDNSLRHAWVFKRGPLEEAPWALTQWGYPLAQTMKWCVQGWVVLTLIALLICGFTLTQKALLSFWDWVVPIESIQLLAENLVHLIEKALYHAHHPIESPDTAVPSSLLPGLIPQGVLQLWSVLTSWQTWQNIAKWTLLWTFYVSLFLGLVGIFWRTLGESLWVWGNNVLSPMIDTLFWPIRQLWGGKSLFLPGVLHHPIYKNNQLKASLKTLFTNPETQRQYTLNDLQNPQCPHVLIPTTDLTDGTPFYFRDPQSTYYPRPEEPTTTEALWDTPLWQVALATSAGPVFFPTVTIPQLKKQFADGGLFANTPDLLAFHEASAYLGYAPQAIILLSLGTLEHQLRHTGEEEERWGVVDWLLENMYLIALLLGLQHAWQRPLLQHWLGERYLRVDLPHMSQEHTMTNLTPPVLQHEVEAWINETSFDFTDDEAFRAIEQCFKLTTQILPMSWFKRWIFQCPDTKPINPIP
jgi:predicted acylesterase/phospholipase RssA